MATPKDSGKETLEWLRMLQEEAKSQRDLQREETKLMIAAQQEQTKLLMELMSQKQTAAMDKITQVLEGMNNNPFDALRQMLPDGDEWLKRLFAPPQSQNVIKLGDGQVTLETYMQIKEQERKDGMFAVVRENLPKFIEMGTDLAAATRRLTSGPQDVVVEPEQPQIPEGYRYTACAGCQATLAYNPEDISFACPGCGARQSTPQLLPPVVEPEAHQHEAPPKEGIKYVDVDELTPMVMIPPEPLMTDFPTDMEEPILSYLRPA